MLFTSVCFPSDPWVYRETTAGLLRGAAAGQTARVSETDEAGAGRRWVIGCPGIPHQPSVTHSIRTSHVLHTESSLLGGGGDTTQRETFIGEAMRRLERSEQRGDGIFTPNPR